MYQKSLQEKAAFYYSLSDRDLREFIKRENLFAITLRVGVWDEEAMQWCHTNCPRKFFHRSWTFYFENEKDAVMFKLRWG